MKPVVTVWANEREEDGEKILQAQDLQELRHHVTIKMFASIKARKTPL